MKMNSAGSGAARGIRTPDPLITNEVLYQLSYCGDADPLRGIGLEMQGGAGAYCRKVTLPRAGGSRFSGPGSSGAAASGKTTGVGWIGRRRASGEGAVAATGLGLGGPPPVAASTVGDGTAGTGSDEDGDAAAWEEPAEPVIAGSWADPSPVELLAREGEPAG
jgi:hypothetical protein